jgi:DNA-binding winged helix-turn-helix (wHTH) protein
MDVQIVGLRRKLGSCRDCIQSVRGVGYRFRDNCAANGGTRAHDPGFRPSPSERINVVSALELRQHLVGAVREPPLQLVGNPHPI